jgi:hypothetical protein
MEFEMNVSSFRPRLLGSSVLIAAAIAFGASLPVSADTVSQTVTPGVLSASIANVVLTGVTAKNVVQAQTGTLVLTADDSRGVAEADSLGWNVVVSTSVFVADAAALLNGGSNIAAVNLSLTSAATPVVTVGQAVTGGAGNGPIVNTTTGTLDSATKVILANPSFGSGTYTQSLGVSLSVPAFTRQGTYLGTLTVTNSTGI